jgi:ubiquinone/menaquinone biosynthesis C-methylase UbiE
MQKELEEVKSYWDSRPCNIRHSASPVGTRQYFDEVEARKYFVEPHIPLFAEFAKWRDKSVLEVGCGIGTDAINFLRNGANYTGVELSEESLSLARKRSELFGLGGEFVYGNAEDLSSHISPTKFDLIYSFGVLHHTPDITKALDQIRSFCHDGTVLKIMLYAENSWKDAMIRAGLDQPEAQTGCPIANTYTRSQVQDLLSNSDFKVESIKQDHIFPYVVEKYKNYEYVKEPWFSAMSDTMFRALEEKFGWHLLIEATPSRPI